MPDRLDIDVIWLDVRTVRVHVVERPVVGPLDTAQDYRSTRVGVEPIEREDVESEEALHARLRDLTIAEEDGALVDAWCYEQDWSALMDRLGLRGDDRAAVVRLQDDGG